MRLRCLVVAALLTWIVVVAGASTAAPLLALGGDLPDGEGRETVERVCGDCHEADNVADRLRTRAEWRALVRDMIERGAAATEEDEAVIFTYVFSNFGQVNVNRASGEDLVAVLRLTTAEAAAIVEYRMNGEFTSLDDLRKVPGVDAAKIGARKQHITFTGA